MVCTIWVPQSGPQQWECRVLLRGLPGIPSSSFFKRVLVWVFCWQPTPVFLLGKFRGKRSLAGCSPWGHTESDTTEHRMHIRYFVECPSICLVIRLQFQILGKNTTEVMCPAHGLMLGTTYYQYVLLLIVYCVSCSTISDSQTLAHQSSLSMGFSRQEYWSG